MIDDGLSEIPASCFNAFASLGDLLKTSLAASDLCAVATEDVLDFVFSRFENIPRITEYMIDLLLVLFEHRPDSF